MPPGLFPLENKPVTVIVHSVFKHLECGRVKICLCAFGFKLIDIRGYPHCYKGKFDPVFFYTFQVSLK